MRSLIYARSDDGLWIREFFPDVEPYLLKIVNKPLLEYYLDLVSLLKVSEVRIVSDSSIKDIESYFKDGTKWGVSISYALARPNDKLDAVYLKNYSFCKEDDTLFFEGLFFIQYDRRDLENKIDFSHSFACHKENSNLMFLKKGESFKSLISSNLECKSCLAIREIRTILDYYNLSKDILINHNQAYVLPGYSNEKDAFYGLNFIFPYTAKIAKPIMIGNNCRFRKYTTVGPNSIIGDNVIIDENTSIKDSIIYDNTYVGLDLDIESKIVYKSHLICGITGEAINLIDRGLVSQVKLGIMTSMFNRMVQWIAALVIVSVQSIPWVLLFWPISVFMSNLKREAIVDKALNTKRVIDPQALCNSFWGRIMLRFCLEKYELLWQVLFGRLYLVGNYLFSNNVHHRKLVKDLPAYDPGVFSLVESVDPPSHDYEEFFELEYINNCSTRFNLRILYKTIVRRLKYGNCK